VKHVLIECPLYADERELMWTRIKGFRRTTDLRVLLGEKKAAVAIAQFVHDTGMLAQFLGVDSQAMGTYEEAQESTEWDTDMGKRTNAQAGDLSSRSAHSPVRTNNSTDTSLGLIQLSESVDENVPQEEDGDVSVHVGESSYIGDEQGNRTRIRAIDLWD
jgi:hypothetical protein